MEISELKAFVAVVEFGSFSGAAEKIHLSQPAISKRIAQLESRIKSPLFDRIGHRVQLTEAGLKLLPHAQKILDALQDGLNDIEQLDKTPRGILRIGTSYHAGLHYLPSILKPFYSDYPEIDLDLHFMDSENALAAIEKGHIELAIITLPAQLSKHLEARSVWSDPMQIYCATNHPLAASDDMRDLVRFSAILPDTNTITRQLVEKEMERMGLHLNVRLSSNHLESIRMMVEIGLGWSVLPVTLQSPELHLCMFPNLRFRRELGIVVNKQRTLTHAARLLIERIEHSGIA
jgi:DNA-binding transcriptional LysR family regulator